MPRGDAPREPTVRKLLRRGGDRLGASARSLSPHERRARIEVTTDATELEKEGISKIEDLFGFRFETLKKHFRFMLATTPHPNPMDGRPEEWVRFRMRNRVNIMDQIGVWAVDETERAMEAQRQEVRRMRAAQPGLSPAPRLRPMGKDGFLAAYNAMNEKVRDALRGLTL